MNEFDIDLMLALNFNGGSFLDVLMWYSSRILIWAPLYLMVLWMIYRRYGWRYMLFALLFFAVGIGLCDQICNLFKDNIPYLRPTRDPEVAPFLHTVRGYRGGTYGTVSGHASTSFSVFLLSILIIRRRWFALLMLTYTLLVSYSRIYLGVHFPMQIVFGITLGTMVALIMWVVLKKLNEKYCWTRPEWRPGFARYA